MHYVRRRASANVSARQATTLDGAHHRIAKAIDGRDSARADFDRGVRRSSTLAALSQRGDLRRLQGNCRSCVVDRASCRPSGSAVSSRAMVRRQWCVGTGSAGSWMHHRGVGRATQAAVARRGAFGRGIGARAVGARRRCPGPRRPHQRRRRPHCTASTSNAPFVVGHPGAAQDALTLWGHGLPVHRSRSQTRALRLALRRSRSDSRSQTPMKRRCAKLRSRRARRTLSAASSMSYSMRLNSKRFLSVSYAT